MAGLSLLSLSKFTMLKTNPSRIDMLSAIYTRTKPIILVDELSLLSDKPYTPTLATTGFNSLLQHSYEITPIIQSLQELVSLTSDIRALSGILPAHDELYSFTARRSWIEWSLSMIDSPGIENCVRLAALVYINIVLRKMPCASAVLSHLANELRLALEGTNLESNWEEKVELLLWVLFQGGAATTKDETRKWYFVHLVHVCSILGLQNWKEVDEILNSFVWARCDLVERCKPLWCEIVVGLSNFYSIELLI
jgi:hypothetical protein